MDIYDFWLIKQEPGESLQNFHRRLKEKAILCKFPNQDVEIKTQIIHHTSDSRIRRKALRKSMNLKTLLDYGYSLEKSDLDSKRIEKGRQNETVNYTDRPQREKPRRTTRQNDSISRTSPR